MTTIRPRHGLPAFTLREMLLVVAMLGIAVAWWVDHDAQSEEIAGLVVQLAKQKESSITEPKVTFPRQPRESSQTP